MDKTLLSEILQRRLDEVVGQRLPRIELVGEDAAFARAVKDRYTIEAVNWPKYDRCSVTWLKSDADCLSFIRDLSIGSAPTVYPGHSPPSELFAESLLDTARDPKRRFELLLERYACPFNISFPAEDAVREHILMRTMVQDRAIIERNFVGPLNSDDILLRLNLIAIHAVAASDLRFLDSLNYYYELLPAGLGLNGQHNWLWASFLVLYAQALAANA